MDGYYWLIGWFQIKFNKIFPCILKSIMVYNIINIVGSAEKAGFLPAFFLKFNYF